MDERGIQKASNSGVLKVANSKKVVYKNLLIVGAIQLLSNAAIAPTVALVTTTAGKTLGNITFGLNNVFGCLSGFFIVCMLDKEISRKTVILLGNACIVGFTACNWYVSYYTLIPGTLLFGFGESASFIGSLMYIKKLTVDYAKNYNLNEQHITSLFIGVVVGLSVAGYTLGNATSSGVLMLLKSKDNENDSISVDEGLNLTNHDSVSECHTNDDKLEFNFITMNILRGLIVFYSLMGFIIAFFLDNLKKNNHQKTSFQPRLFVFNIFEMVWLNGVSVAKLVIKKEMIMSFPLFIASGASLSFVLTIYTKVSWYILASYCNFVNDIILCVCRDKCK